MSGVTDRLAVIPARGGSKRLPGKNLMPFRGREMIAHSIQAAVDTDLFSRIVVSTDDEAIACVARREGAQVIERPAALADDDAVVADVLLHVLSEEAAQGREYDILCSLYATAPLRTAEDVAATLALLARGRCHYAMAVTRYDLPAHQALRVEPDGTLRPLLPELIRLPSDRVGSLCVDNGSTYCAFVDAYLENRGFFGEGLRGYLMPRERSVDLDTPEDLEMLEYHAARLLDGERP